MILNIEQTTINYLNKFGFLFENDALVILEDIKQEEKIKEIKEKFKKKREILDNNKETLLDKLKEFGESVLGEYTDSANEKIANKIEEKKQRIRNMWFAKKAYLNAQELKEIQKLKFKYKTTGVISGVTLASMIIYTSFQIYKDTNNKYKKNCEKKTGKDRERCILHNRSLALKNRINFLNGATIKCNKSQDPLKCKDKLDEEILKIREKLRDDIEKFKEIAGEKAYGI